ncbi:peptide/nickel transport system permease protein [Acetitomaculum ruminis DSM 5522]|uniref:Peptide/nickel transport system permease protein n=1 Tax=Acetitomaculum ruminis DSM 5522 TaxID=1120918 RepID=A0A1I0ZPD5_9FIRM|nr:ABC transporter permease [Acetitomaculum ruminis]SFB26238.1 peptide/nickel transport system permease protein [Acetitomaculum ruminis DSM 5522]
MVAKNYDFDERFKIVGIKEIKKEEKTRKEGIRQRLEGKPVISAIVLTFIVLACIFAPVIANHDPSEYYLDALNTPPGREYIFGTDSLGRDLFSIMFYGGRTSLMIGVLGAAIVTVIGTIYGCISGTSGDKVDSLMMRAMELCGSIPSILLILILTAIFPAKNVFSMSIIVGITSWFALARIVRSEVRQIRNSEYVLYARCVGGNFFYVMKRHLIPNFISSIMFVVVSSVGACITTESTLSFLGLGLPLDILSWGSMLSLANKALIMNTWWVIVIPGLFLVITLLCITDIGNYLRKEVNRRPSNL